MKDLELNKVISEVWRIDDKLNNNKVILDGEMEFYVKNINVIKEYYHKQNEYWKTKNVRNIHSSSRNRTMEALPR